MKKIAWITDSASGLSQAFIKEHNIHVVPLQLIVNHETYREGIDITTDEFYNILKEHGEGAKTSQPALGEFVDLYNKLKEEYEIGIALHASSELTGTYQTSLMASKITGFDIEAIDSKMGAYVLGKLVQYAMSLEKKGKSVEEIVKAVEKMSKRAEMFLLPASFTQMKNSGRVSTSQALIANLLNINIVLGFDDGKVVVEEKIRGKKKVKSEAKRS